MTRKDQAPWGSADETPDVCSHPNKKVEVSMATVVIWCPDCGMILDTKRIKESAV